MPKDQLVRRGQVKPHGDPANISCAIGMDLSLVLSGKLGHINMLTGILQEAVDQVVARCEANGLEVYIRSGTVQPVPHEVLVSLVPRRIHYGEGRHICKTQFVSHRNLTTDDSKVTCRWCRKLRGLDAEGSRDKG